MLTNEQRDALLNSRPERTVTKEQIEGLIEHTEFWNPEAESTLTVCVLKLKNGFTVVGKSACAHPKNFDAELGKKIAWDDAFRQVWQLEGYLLREVLWQEQQASALDEDGHAAAAANAA
jgi:hypothetical protein